MCNTKWPILYTNFQMPFVLPIAAGLGPRTPVRSAEITVHTTTMGAEGPSSLCSDPWSPPHTVTSTNAAYSSSSSSSSRGEVLRHLGRVVAGAGVFSLVGTLGGPPPALADNALIATKQSYFRYVPRIQVGAWVAVCHITNFLRFCAPLVDLEGISGVTYDRK